jgi:hypothetical protein
MSVIVQHLVTRDDFEAAVADIENSELRYSRGGRPKKRFFPD